MDKPYTLRTLLAEHPEWADLPIAAGKEDGTMDYVGWAGSVYTVTHEDIIKDVGTDTVLIFQPN